MDIKCVWLDGGVAKACRVLKARLEPLGIRVVCRLSLPDGVIDELARREGCVVVSTDKMSPRFGWVLVDHKWVERKSARDIATRVIKLLGLLSGKEWQTR